MAPEAAPHPLSPVKHPLVAARGWRPRVFATPADEPRARRASDVTLLLVSAAVLALLSLAAVPLPGFARAVNALLDAIPPFFDGLWQVVVDGLALLAVVLLVVTLARSRLTVARDVVLAALVAAGLSLVLARLVTGGWPNVGDALTATSPPPWFPSLRLAVPAAMVITASPHLVRPLRRLGRWLVVLAMLAMSVLGATSSLGALASLLVATIAASAVHLAFGSSGGRPGLAEVRAALVELGVEATALRPAEHQPSGLFLVEATGAKGERLLVKIYGRDAHDAAVLTSLWRTLWYREGRATVRLGRLQQVEHEAFVTLLAAQAGVPTDAVVSAGSTATDDAMLVLVRRGTLVAEGDAVDGHEAARLWATLAALHAARIGHGQIDDQHLLRDGEARGLVGFRGAGVTPSEAERRTDQAQLLFATAVALGADAAVAVARDALGVAELTAMLPYLQISVLTPHQRRHARSGGLDLDALRTAAADAAGTEAPAMARLRRVTLGSALRVLLPALALVLVLSAMAGLDLQELVQQLEDAAWWLVVVAALAAQLPRFSQAVSTLGASPVALPLGPVYALQLAVSYVNVAVPTSAGRIAVTLRFFQRQGAPPATALAASGLDTVSGLMIEAVLLVVLVFLTPASLDLQLDSVSVDSAADIALLVGLIVLAAVTVVLAVGRLRRFVLGWGRRIATEVLSALRGLRSPRRLGLLFGGNLATEVLFSVALGLFARALGYSIGLGELLLINVSVNLLSGLLPVPGGIGVNEAGLTFGLVRAGMPEELALTTALLYRLFTFYLPPIWGWFAFRWLERNRHI